MRARRNPPVPLEREHPYNWEIVRENDTQWSELAKRRKPSWYLDPVVARQKKLANQALIRKWTRNHNVGSLLKTDLFEEAYGEDQILFDLFPQAGRTLAIDIAEATVHRAKSRSPLPRALFLTCDVRNLALGSNLVDLVVSTSTLDHFATPAEFQAALGELARVLRPGGTLIVTLDNVRNPFYPLLRWVSRRGRAPFRMGYTTSDAGLARSLEQAGLEVTDTGALIHNPRLLSTLLFLCLRRLLGKHADAPVQAFLRLFATFERLPTQRFTACFVAACARKPVS